MSGEHIGKSTEKAPKPEDQTSVFVKRKRTFTLAFLGIAAILVISAIVTNYDVIGGFT